MSEKFRILEKVKGLQTQGAAAAGAVGRGFAGFTRNANRFSENLARVRPESWRDGSNMFQQIRETDWDKAYGTFESFRSLITQNFGSLGAFIEAFAKWFEMMDAFLGMYLSDELKGLYEWLFSDQGVENAKGAAYYISEIFKSFGKLSTYTGTDKLEQFLELLDAIADAAEYAGKAIGDWWIEWNLLTSGQSLGRSMSFGGMGIGGFSMPSLGSGNSKVLDNVTKSFW